MNKGLKLAVAAAVFGMFLSGAVFTVSAQNMSKEEMEARLRGIEQNKAQSMRPVQQQQANRRQMKATERPQGAELEAIIAKYEKLLDGCAGRKSDRCADVIFTLGGLYSDQGQKDKSLKMYWQLTREYPNFPNVPEAYFKMSENYRLAGHLDTARIILEQIAQSFPNYMLTVYYQMSENYIWAGYNDIECTMLENLILKFPNSPHVSNAQFRLGELAFMDNNFNKAYEYFNNVKKDQVDIITWEANNFNMGLSAYMIGDFKKGDKYFSTYLKTCNKCNDRESALTFIKSDKAAKAALVAKTKQAAQTKRAERVAQSERAAKEAVNAAKAEQARQAEQVRQAEEARQAELAAKEAAKAAYDALPTVPVGTGYDKVSWGSSVVDVMSIYQDSKIERGGDIVSLIQENVGKGISGRKFSFLQDKLTKVSVAYLSMTKEDANLLFEKITSIYGKPNTINDLTKKNYAIEYTWEYNKKMKITLTRFDPTSAYIQLEDKNKKQPPIRKPSFNENITDLDESLKMLLVAGLGSGIVISIDYEDLPALERLQKEKIKKAEEDKKKRSDGLGL